MPDNLEFSFVGSLPRACHATSHFCLEFEEKIACGKVKKMLRTTSRALRGVLGGRFVFARAPQFISSAFHLSKSATYLNYNIGSQRQDLVRKAFQRLNDSEFTEKKDYTDRPATVPKAIENLTGEMTETLLKGNEHNKFKLEFAKETLAYLGHTGFPLPEELSEEQWRQLFNLELSDTRARFLLRLACEWFDVELPYMGYTYEEALEAEAEAKKGLEFTEEQVRNLVGDRYRETFEILKKHIQEEQDGGLELPRSISDLQLNMALEKIRKGHGIAGTIEFWALNQQKRNAIFLKKARKSWDGQKKKQEREESGWTLNTIFLRIYNSKISFESGYRVMRQGMEGMDPQHMVIDMSFLSQMNGRCLSSMLNMELPYAVNANKESWDPFSMHFVNYDPKNYKHKSWLDYMTGNTGISNSFDVHEESYLDLFPKENLLMLSPDSKNDLLEFNEDDVYIIGALNDNTIKAPFTLSDAKKQGIRHARLPMKRYCG